MKAFEDASGKELDEDKKELASEELITTGDLGDEIGQDKATGVMEEGEYICLKVLELDQLIQETSDVKAICAYSLYQVYKNKLHSFVY